MMRKRTAFLLLAAGLCSGLTTNTYAQQSTHRPASIGILGDTADVTTTVKPGVALIGGGTDIDAAFKWLLNRSGGGDVVVLRATGTDAYNEYIDKLGTSNSVETLLINSRDIANNDSVANIIRNAELLFIAGGDQSNYMRYWRNTKTADAINYLLRVKKVPVGGTSAGCAILGSMYYSGEGGSVTSEQGLANPYDALIKVYTNDFLQAPYLQNVITDQHYLARNREGRHLAFMARIIKDKKIFPKGIAPDESTAVCIDENGKATVVGNSKAYFIATDKKKAPEQVVFGSPLKWTGGQKALKVYEIQGSETGSGSFNVATFAPSEAQGGTWYWWWVENGQFHKQVAQ
jgi:cyanophycinase